MHRLARRPFPPTGHGKPPDKVGGGHHWHVVEAGVGAVVCRQPSHPAVKAVYPALAVALAVALRSRHRSAVNMHGRRPAQCDSKNLPRKRAAMTAGCDRSAQAGTSDSGTAGSAWGATERAAWLAQRRVQRSYAEDVLAKLNGFKERFVVQHYGSLSHDPKRYPLFSVRTHDWSDAKPSVLITGGVHGYETSGVHGAILFLEQSAALYARTFNILVAPCISPWGYETIQRWNPQATDPNRSFNPDGVVVEGRSFNPEPATEESSTLISHLKTLGVRQWTCHIDLHETTDTDELEFRPAKAARDGVAYAPGEIPDGFYLVADISNPQMEWHKSIIDAVRRVTHIAPPDKDNKIIDEPVIQEGVIGIPPPREVGLCAGMTNALYTTTTEVYPDSPKADDDQCNRAQVAAITAALDHIIAVGVSRRPFVPTCDWQEVPPGAVCPAGLEFRMDMAAGVNYARLLPQ